MFFVCLMLSHKFPNLHLDCFSGAAFLLFNPVTLEQSSEILIFNKNFCLVENHQESPCQRPDPTYWMAGGGVQLGKGRDGQGDCFGAF